MTGLLTAFLAEVALITYRNVKPGISVPTDAPIPAPLPSVYAAPAIAFGLLGLVPSRGQSVAGMIGWGLVAATFLNLFVLDPKTGAVSVNKPTAAPAAPAKKAG